MPDKFKHLLWPHRPHKFNFFHFFPSSKMTDFFPMMLFISSKVIHTLALPDGSRHLIPACACVCVWSLCICVHVHENDQKENKTPNEAQTTLHSETFIKVHLD